MRALKFKAERKLKYIQNHVMRVTRDSSMNMEGKIETKRTNLVLEMPLRECTEPCGHYSRTLSDTSPIKRMIEKE